MGEGFDNVGSLAVSTVKLTLGKAESEIILCLDLVPVGLVVLVGEYLGLVHEAVQVARHLEHKDVEGGLESHLDHEGVGGRVFAIYVVFIDRAWDLSECLLSWSGQG